MRCEDTSAQLVDYLAGTQPDAERHALEQHLQSCETCRTELQNVSETWQQLGDVKGDQPDSRAMRARFDAMLADAERAQAATQMPMQTKAQPWLHRYRGMQPLLQAAAAVLLLIAGIQLGRGLATPSTPSSDMHALREEVRDLRQMVTLSLMQQQSASERLKGVSFSNRLDQPGNEVVSALIDTLMHDSNVNVRLASIDALRRFAERDTVRTAAIHALDTQTSPLVQMALIDFVVETQERGAIDALRRLSRDDMTDQAVRVRAKWGIDHLGAV
jgi:putative zinc finger protein/HEAT repeat protein